MTIGAWVWASQVALEVKNPPAMQATWVPSPGQEDALEEGMATHSIILAWRIHGQRSLVGYSPWGCKESDTTKVPEHACPTQALIMEAFEAPCIFAQ